MKLPTLTAKVYLSIFLIIILGLYSGFNYRLFSNAEALREQTHQKTLQLAKNDIQTASKITLQRIKSQLDRITTWDEVYQQLNDASYYLYWKENSLKQSDYWFTYFQQLEFYDIDKKKVSPTKASSFPIKGALPESIPEKMSYFKGTDKHLDYYLYLPIYDRTNIEIIGYAGLSVDFSDMLLQSFQLLHVDKSSVVIKADLANKMIEPGRIFDLLTFEPTKNPVNDFLWELIQDYIREVLLFGIFIALLFAVFFTRLVSSPLKRLTNYVNTLQSDTEKVQPPLKANFLITEIENLKKAIFHYHRQLVTAHIEIDKQHQIAYEQARLDPLSHVFNRRGFDEHWSQLLLHFHEAPRNICFMILDCDFFKAINDTYGHEVGDDVIRISAATIKKSLPLDTNLFRIGGDEFVAIIENRHLDECEDIARRCYEAISNYDFSHLGIKEQIYYSIGMSFVSAENSHELSMMNKNADIALYQAKKSLHNKICLYQEDMNIADSVLVSTERVNAIVYALQNWKYLYMYQQKVQPVNPNEQTYSEALIRIKQDDSIIFPDEILNVVLHRRMEADMDKAVLCNLYNLLITGKIPKGTGLSINITAQTIFQEDLIELFKPFCSYLKDYKIVIEILESTLISNLDEIKDSLQQLRSEGFKIALDDFGSGYSSIQYLAWMPVDIIKFDISLTQCLMGDKKTQKIIYNTASMIRSAGYDLVMEGIETEEMSQAAIKAGATHLQGYFIEKPNPIVP